MDIHDATEQAYRNGYKAGVNDLAKQLRDIYLNDKRYDRPDAHTLIAKLFANIDNTALALCSYPEKRTK